MAFVQGDERICHAWKGRADERARVNTHIRGRSESHLHYLCTQRTRGDSEQTKRAMVVAMASSAGHTLRKEVQQPLLLFPLQGS